MSSADAVVVGGGLHGCSAALHLARAGLDVVLLEKDHVGRHASGVNAGGVRRLGRAVAELPLAAAASERWLGIAELVGDDCGFVPAGQVKVAESEDELAAMRGRVRQLAELGFTHERIIDRDELRARVPALAPHCVGGIWVEGDGFADPARTVRMFARRARDLGVEIRERSPVVSVDRRGDGWRVATAGGTVDAPAVVNCAGAWGARIAAMFGEELPLAAHAPMLMITARLAPFLGPVVGAEGRTLSFKQFPIGTVLIGGGERGVASLADNRTRLDPARLAVNARTAADLFPAVAGATVVRCWAGIEGYTPDHLPIIGRGAADGLVHMFGFSAHGFQLGPAAGALVADLVLGDEPRVPIGPFSPTRFAAGGTTSQA